MDVIALVGQVTKAETSRLLGEDFSGWKLRKDNPGTPGSSVRGMRERKRENFVLVCASLVLLERAAQQLTYEGRARRVVVVVKETARLDLVRLPNLTSQPGLSVSFSSDANGFVLSVTSENYDVNIGEVTASVICPESRLHSSTRVAAQDALLAGLLQPSRRPGVGIGAVSQEPDSIPPFDVFLTNDDSYSGIESEDSAVLRDLGIDVQPIAPENAIAVDTRWLCPIGFEAEPVFESVDLKVGKVKHRHLLSVSVGSSIVGTFDVSWGVDENVISRLRPFRRVHLQWETGVEDAVVARVLTGLGCAGVPLLLGVPHLSCVFPPSVVELIAKFQKLTEVDLQDNLARQQWSVATRRWALQSFSLKQMWDSISERMNYPPLRQPAVSVVIPTRRAHLVGSVVNQALNQLYPNIEVVVGLHGMSNGQVLEYEPWLKGHPRVRLMEYGATYTLGQILNALTEVSQGELVTKMDDDDLYSRHHVGDLVVSSEYSGADLVGCKAEFVYLENHDRTLQMRPNSEIYDASVTGGTILLGKQLLREVGGWNSVGTAEDRLLQASIKKAGGRVYRSHGLNYMMRRGDGDRMHTWNPQPDIFERQAIRSWDGLGYPGWESSTLG